MVTAQTVNYVTCNYVGCTASAETLEVTMQTYRRIPDGWMEAHDHSYQRLGHLCPSHAISVFGVSILDPTYRTDSSGG